MTFSQLAKYFEKLESTASRNSMVEILAELFRAASVDEIDKIVYLTQGRVVPLYEHFEFGMAEKMIIKALVRAYNTTEAVVTANYKKTGDVGLTAEDLATSLKVTKLTGLSVEEVFDRLKKLPEMSGDGSVEMKVDFLANLFRDGDPLSSRYLARIPVDKMRLGFSDMTVLEGLSWMIDHTKKHKTVIESAYNIRPDLGYIAKQVKELGIKGVAHVKPKVGTPILGMRAERATSPEEILEKTEGAAAIESKLDGLRTQLHYARGEVTLFSRGLENVTNMYPDLVAAAKSELKEVDSIILDGEAIGFDPKSGKYLMFQETTQRKRKYDVAAFSVSIPVKLITFDCLYLNGESLISEPYQKRRAVVEKVLGKGKILLPAEMEIVTNPLRVEEIFSDNVSGGREGIMAKKVGGVYQAGARGWNWIKFKKSYASKLADTVDAVVMGYDYGQGQRNKFGIGSFLIGVYDHKSDSFKTISKVGTGLTDEEWRTLAENGKRLAVSEKPKNYEVNKIMNCDVWIKPKLVGEFKADELTKSPMHTAGFALRFPRLEKWREKNPEDTTNLSEINRLAKLQ